MFVACATDPHYVELAGVLISSVARNGEIPDATLIVCDYGLRDKDRAALRACAAGRPIEFVAIDKEARRRLAHLKRTSSWSRAMYSRLLLPELMAGAGKLLYLDCDMVVRQSLRPLFETPLEGRTVAAVSDIWQGEALAARNATLGRAADAPYLNSGMLLIDLDRWRAADCGGRCLDIMSRGQTAYPDQDALNRVLDGDWVEVDKRWNFFELNAYNYARAHFDQAAILHFTSRKPNLAHCRHPAQDVYLAERAFTPWKDRPLVSDFRRRLRREWIRLEIRVETLLRRVFGGAGAAAD